MGEGGKETEKRGRDKLLYDFIFFLPKLLTEFQGSDSLF